MEVPVEHSVMVGLPLCVPDAEADFDAVPQALADLDVEGEALSVGDCEGVMEGV